MKQNRTLIAIPARGGSKRLARKNMLSLAGKPMLAFTIEAALSSHLSEKVYVCTEDDEIARVAEKHGANVFRIPVEMAGDFVSSTVPCLHLAENLAKKGEDFEYLFNLQPSSPLRTGKDLTESFATLRKEGADYLVSATPIDPHYFHWALSKTPDGWAMYFGADFLKERSLLPPVLRPNGAIKLAKLSCVRETGNFFGKNLAVHLMPEERSIHVATQFDMDCAEAVFKNHRI